MATRDSDILIHYTFATNNYNQLSYIIVHALLLGGGGGGGDLLLWVMSRGIHQILHLRRADFSMAAMFHQWHQWKSKLHTDSVYDTAIYSCLAFFGSHTHAH